jgi:DNA-binding PadR family transcriptional regulator
MRLYVFVYTSRHMKDSKDSLSDHWFQILLSLAGQDLHGLAITAEVLERTEGRVHLWPGMLYGALKEMTTRGYVVETVAPPDAAPGGGRPRFYHLTPLGRKLCSAEATRLARSVDVARARRLLKGNRGG